jgi:hypothetical protein
VLDALAVGTAEVRVDEFSRTVEAALPDDLDQLYPEIQSQLQAAA